VQALSSARSLHTATVGRIRLCSGRAGRAMGYSRRLGLLRWGCRASAWRGRSRFSTPCRVRKRHGTARHPRACPRVCAWPGLGTPSAYVRSFGISRIRLTTPKTRAPRPGTRCPAPQRVPASWLARRRGAPASAAQRSATGLARRTSPSRSCRPRRAAASLRVRAASHLQRPCFGPGAEGGRGWRCRAPSRCDRPAR
jgi:hypothetical protein